VKLSSVNDSSFVEEVEMAEQVGVGTAEEKAVDEWASPDDPSPDQKFFPTQ
jgi:hypothetical protein